MAADALLLEVGGRAERERVLGILRAGSGPARPRQDLKARHRHIPWRRIAGVGNVLRHGHQRIRDDEINRPTCGSGRR
jgi:hypothetical protein